MNGIETLVSILRTQGEVMLHDGRSGWVNAVAGMVFPPGSDITVKTGSSGSAELINHRGELVSIGPGALKVISHDDHDFEIDTLRHFRITTGELINSGAALRKRLSPAA